MMPASLDGHFELKAMRERVKAIGGRLTVQSTTNQGTTIGLSVPGRLAYRKDKRSWFRRILHRPNSTEV